MGTHAQILVNVLTTPIALLGGEARGHSDDLMTSSLSLIFKDSKKRAPTRVVDTLSKMVITRHPRHVQVFDTNAAISVGILFSRFEVEVAPLTTNLQVLLGHFALGLVAAMANFLAAITYPLSGSESFLTTAIVPGILHNRAVRIGQKHL